MTCHTHKQTRQTHYQAWAKRELNYVNNHQVKQVENYIPHTSIWNYLIKLYPMWRHTLERQHEHCLLRHWRLLHHHGTIATGQRLHCHLPVSLSWLVHTIQALQGRNIEKNGIILILKTCKFTQQVVRWWYMRCVSLHRCEKQPQDVLVETLHQCERARTFSVVEVSGIGNDWFEWMQARNWRCSL